MSYWTPRADAPLALCPDESCERRTDCRRYIERAELRERGAEVLPIWARWKPAPVLDAHGRPVGVRQECRNFLPREAM